MSDKTSNILAAALTSAVVALGIEWLAKPRLEARKERILAAHRARRELQGHLFTIGMAAARLNRERMPRDLTDENRQALRREDERAMAQIDAATEQLLDTLADTAGTYLWIVRDMVVKYATVARIVTISARIRREKAEILVECTRPMLEYLFGPWWRPDRRLRGGIHAQQALKKYGGGD